MGRPSLQVVEKGYTEDRIECCPEITKIHPTSAGAPILDETYSHKKDTPSPKMHES